MAYDTAADGERGRGRAMPGEAQMQARSAVKFPNVRGVVLAGVHAWGDCVLEQTVCRPMLPVAGRPLLWHALSWVRRGGVLEASICGNSDTALFRRTFGTGEALGISLEYSEDVMPRGPAGCVRDAAHDTGAEAIVVVDGTLVPRTDLASLLRAHALSDAALTLGVRSVGAGNGHPGVEQEPAGVYVFSRSVLEKVPATGYQDIKESLIPDLYRRGERVVTHLVPTSLVPRVTDAASYLGVNMWVVERMVQEGTIPEGYVQVGEAWVDPSARVDPTARLVGPVLVGARSAIEAGALIVGPTTIGDDCAIGSDAVITRSVIWDRCEVGVESILDQCILTHDVSVDTELVARETVFVGPRRTDRRLVNRLASYCWPARRRTRLIKGMGARSRRRVRGGIPTR